jgi:hypothetical protein
MTNVNERNKLPQSDGPECFDDGTGIEPEITESEDIKGVGIELGRSFP